MIDEWTIALASAIVIVVTASVFIVLMLAYKDSQTGRLWAGGFLAGILTTFSYLMWSLNPAAWWAVAVGNLSLVAGAGLFWLGCRLYNGRQGYSWIVVLGCIATAGAVLLEGPDGGPWAGAAVYFVGVAVFAALAAFETARGELGRVLGARVLITVFTLQSLYAAGRLVSFIIGGPESKWFSLLFGSSAFALVTMILVIVTSMIMALIVVQLAGSVRRDYRGNATSGSVIDYNGDGVLPEVAFERVVTDWLERAAFHHEQLAIFHFCLDDLDEIHAAFGRGYGESVVTRFVASVRRFGPPHSDIGLAGAGRLVLATAMSSADEAIAAARAVQAALLEEPLASFAGVRPTLSVGISLSDYAGFDYDALNDAARGACARALESGGNRVMVDARAF